MSSSLQQYENTNIIADTICLAKQNEDIPYVIIEGVFDYRIFEKFVKPSTCKLFAPNGKNNIIPAIIELYKRGKKDCIAIRDRDYDVLINPNIRNVQNLFLTDFRDLEMTILNSEAIHHMLKQYITTTDDYMPIILSLLNIIKPIGYLRWLNDKEKFGIDFKSTDLLNFIDKKSLDFDKDRYLLALIQNTNRKRAQNDENPLELDLKQLDKDWETLKNEHSHLDDKLICQGHDFINVLSQSLQWKFAKFKAHDVTAEILEKNISLSYDLESFKNSLIYSQLNAWERMNRIYIFK